MSEAPGADTLEPTPGQRLIEGAKEPSTAMPTFPKPRPHHSFSAFARASSRSLRSYLREAGAHFAKSCEMADRALTAESLLAEAGKALGDLIENNRKGVTGETARRGWMVARTVATAVQSFLTSSAKE